jgi:hypothetical protein
MKDALDKKHGFYYLRVGSQSNKYDLNLKIKMYVKGEKMETSETDEELLVYKFP